MINSCSDSAISKRRDSYTRFKTEEKYRLSIGKDIELELFINLIYSSAIRRYVSLKKQLAAVNFMKNPRQDFFFENHSHKFVKF